MNVTAVLCDHAQVSSDSKLYIAGANITRLWASNAEPPLVVNVSLAVIIEIGWQETNHPHKLAVELIYDDQTTGARRVHLPIGPPSASEDGEGLLLGEFNAGRSPDMAPGESSLMPLGVNLPGLQLPGPGSYFFAVSIDGTEMARAAFRAGVIAPHMQGR